MSEKRKVLLVTDEMEVGGTQRQMTNLLLNIDKENIDIELLYFRNDSHLVDELRNSGINVTKIDKSGSIDLSFILKIIKFFRANKFDVIHAFAFSAELWSCIAYLFSPAKKFITSVRGVYEWYSVKHWVIKTLITCFSYKVIANSQSGANYAEAKMLCHKNNMALIYNGIVNKNETNLLEDYVFDEDKFYILSVGRLIEGKNNRLLIQAAAEIAADYPNIEILIIGDGPDKANLSSQIEQCQCGNVKLMGEKSNVPYYMQNSNLLVHPSLREGLSNTILEAFVNKLPVLASNADGNCELVTHEKNGILFKNNNLDDFVEKIKLIMNKQEYLKEYANNAYLRIENDFSVPVMCGKYQKYYE